MFSRRTSWNLAPNRFTEALERARAQGQRTFDLTASNPTTAGFSYDNALLQALTHPQGLTYRPEAKGLIDARRAVAAYYRGRADVLPEQILLTAGTSEAYSFAFRLLCEPGDEVLVAAPGYPLFDFLAELQDVCLLQFPMFYDHGWHLDLHALETAASKRTRAVLLVHPNNPTGSFIKPAEAQQLNALCRARDWALVVDEVFLDFSHGDPATTFAANDGALTFTLSGLSKISGLPQMKLGWMVVSGPPEAAREAVSRLEVIADTYLSVGIPVQLAAPALLDSRHDFQRQLMERVRANLAELDRQLAGHARVRRLEIEAGWYAVLRVPATRSDEELAIEILQRAHVEIHPGHFFDFPADGYLVVSLITPPDDFREGIRRILALL
ncbi:MAG TPA: pyridoxal phosphate-dependent aminotransferase [Terriglobales bacterium]|nr:pyridoxal phosphate-dependent aminotransferase [Terriglobales bacterium]